MKATQIAAIAAGAVLTTVAAGGVGWAIGTNVAQSPRVQQTMEERLEMREQLDGADSPEFDAQRGERPGVHRGFGPGAGMRGGEGPRAEHRLEGHYPMGPGESVEPEESELSEDTDLSDTQEPADEETSPLQ